MADSGGVRLTTLLAGGLGACITLSGCGGGDGAGVTRDAKAKTLSARYLVISGPGGRELFVSPKLTVIKRHGRVLAWTTAREEFTLRGGKRCYERHTEFNRDDVRQQRDNAWPPKAVALDLEERDGVRVLSGRQKNTDSADIEFELFLNDAGRLTMLRQRSAEFGVVPAGRWYASRYRYPTAVQFARLAGAVPWPRCA
jgi:hypothetical protein